MPERDSGRGGEVSLWETFRAGVSFPKGSTGHVRVTRELCEYVAGEYDLDADGLYAAFEGRAVRQMYMLLTAWAMVEAPNDPEEQMEMLSRWGSRRSRDAKADEYERGREREGEEPPDDSGEDDSGDSSGVRYLHERRGA